MNIPKKVLIKGAEWRVKLKKKVLVNGVECDGSAEELTKTIEICSTLPQDQKEWTFWHEYIHAVLIELRVVGNSNYVSAQTEELMCDGFADILTNGTLEINFVRRKRKTKRT